MVKSSVGSFLFRSIYVRTICIFRLEKYQKSNENISSQLVRHSDISLYICFDPVFTKSVCQSNIPYIIPNYAYEKVIPIQMIQLVMMILFLLLSLYYIHKTEMNILLYVFRHEQDAGVFPLRRKVSWVRVSAAQKDNLFKSSMIAYFVHPIRDGIDRVFIYNIYPHPIRGYYLLGGE